jgi:hypothetical protein
MGGFGQKVKLFEEYPVGAATQFEKCVAVLMGLCLTAIFLHVIFQPGKRRKPLP